MAPEDDPIGHLESIEGGLADIERSVDFVASDVRLLVDSVTKADAGLRAAIAVLDQRIEALQAVTTRIERDSAHAGSAARVAAAIAVFWFMGEVLKGCGS